MKSILFNNSIWVKLTCFLILPLMMWQCTEVKDWSDPKDNMPPGILTVTDVQNINGGAWIYYTLPTDNDLLGVKAEFSYNGIDTREVFSSAYNDSILVNGAPSTQEYTVKLYVLDKSQNQSIAVEQSIQPLLPPVEIISQTISLIPTFGGVLTTWEDPFEDPVAISLYVVDSIDNAWVLHDTYYTKYSERVAFRNLHSVEQKMRFEVRDKWNTAYSEEFIITPLFEEEIYGRNIVDNTPIWTRFGYEDGSCKYRGDLSRAGVNWTGIFDDDLSDGGTNTHWYSNIYTLTDYLPSYSNPSYFPLPLYFTIDMQREAEYSNVKYWGRTRQPWYSALYPIDVEIWGCEGIPKATSEVGNGSIEDNLKYWTAWSVIGGEDTWKNDWIPIANYVITFPSGISNKAAPALLSNDDVEYIKRGFEMEMTEESRGHSFRYVRVVIKDTNTSLNQIQLAELKFWGAYK